MEAKSASGAPWEGEISLGNSPGAPPEVHHEFFSAPEASGSDLGAPPGGQNKDFMLRSLFFPPGSDFGAILARFLSVFGSLFEAIWK